VKAGERASTQATVRRALAGIEVRDPLRIEIDVDPQSLL